MSLTPAVLPDYGGANLTGVVPALMERPGRRPAWIPEAARESEQAVLVVIDGLGWLQMQERLHLVPSLASMAGGPVTTVVPSTTAAALTSLVVGAPPASHGVVGYKVAVEGPAGPEVLNVLKWKGASGDARSFVDPESFQSMAPFGGSPVPVVSRAEFIGTAFTEAHQRGARQVGWFSASGLAVDVGRLVAEGERFVYAYYDGVDRIAHMQGFGPYYDAELVAVDRMVGDVLAGVGPDTAVVVTADHGQVQVGSNLVELDAGLMGEVALVSGEPRFRWLHARDPSPAGVDRLAARAEALYGGQAWVVTYAEMEKEGWLGGPLTDPVRSRLGDVALVPFEPIAFKEPGEGPDVRLVCRHGSLTAEEMLVPLLAARGRLER